MQLQQKKRFNSDKFNIAWENEEGKAQFKMLMTELQIYERYSFPLEVIDANLSCTGLRSLYQCFQAVPDFNPDLKSVDDIIRWIFDYGYECKRIKDQTGLDLSVFTKAKDNRA